MIDALKQYIADNEQEMFTLLERLVRINSYTPVKAGVDAVGKEIEQVMVKMGLTVRREPRTSLGDNLVAENAARASGRGVLLCGHMDTVFPPEDGFDRFDLKGNVLNGPGVADMKGGLVVGIFALKALQAAGLLDDMPVAFVFNSDEEIGSPESSDLIMEEARRSDIAFVFECASPGGKIATARKGKFSFDLTVNGQAGHAGNKAEHKPSAVLELAHQIIKFEGLNNPAKGISVNVGIIEGGVGPNTIAPTATARIECRYWQETDGVILKEAAEALAANPTIPGTTCTLNHIPGRPTMEKGQPAQRLFEFFREAGKELGVPVDEESRGGVSDANFIAHVGTPVIDGLGPIGAKDHSHEEYIEADSLARCTLLAAVGIRRAFEAL